MENIFNNINLSFSNSPKKDNEHPLFPIPKDAPKTK
jgi:hypothetical protein